LDHETVVTAVKFSPSPLPRPLLITTERGNFRFNEEGSLEIDGKLHLWDVTFLKQDNSGPDTTRLSESQGHLEKVSTEQKGTWAVAFSHDGQSFITGGGDGSVKLWDLDASADRPFIKQREQFKYPPHKGLAWTIDFNTQNGIGKKLIASGGIDTTIHLQDVDSGDAIVLGGSKGHKGWVTKVVFSSDGQWLASGGSDGTVRLWNVSKVLQQAKEKPNPDPTKPDDLEPEAIMRGHEGMVRSLAFSPDDHWLVSGGGDQILRLWRVQQDMRSEAIREEACKRVWRENITAEELKDIGRDPQEGGWWPCRDNVSPHSSTQPTPARQTAK
jgi:WD40 repeat protein